MNNDARISTSLADHPKTVKLERRLGGEACWALVCLFLWAARNKSDGDLSGMQIEDIEIAAKWRGEEGKLYDALVSVRFLDESEDGKRVVIHDWHDHNPWAAGARGRSEKARKAAKSRWDDAQPEIEQCSNEHQASPSNAPLPLPTPTPSPSPSPKSEPNGSRAPGCPIRAIVDLYHEELPELPRCEKVTANRSQQIRARWREDLPTLDKWKSFFAYVRQSPFLMGKVPPPPGRKPFVATLDWLTKAECFAKIAEEKYHR